MIFGPLIGLIPRGGFEIIGQFSKNQNYSILASCTFLKNCSTSTLRISLNFNPMKVFFTILESSRCLLQPPFGLMSIEFTMFMYRPLRKKDFLRSFRRTCNVLAYIFQMKHFWTWHVRAKVVENSISFKLSFGWEIFDAPCESYGRSKFG